jgi:YfiH family protein
MNSLSQDVGLPIEGFAGLKGFTTTRHGGVSQAPFESFNIGLHVGDVPSHVAMNRQRLRACLPGEPVWLNQVHGVRVVDADVLDAPDAPDVASATTPEADAAITTTARRVLAIQTADCLPVVLVNASGTVLGIAHAGWRGLAAGVLPNTLLAMQKKCPSMEHWQAWIGPCIGPAAFQVGPEVREAFVSQYPWAPSCFRPDLVAAHKWRCDLPGLAREQLMALGAAKVTWCGACTVDDPNERFFSYRRDAQTGRMATLAWLDPS